LLGSSAEHSLLLVRMRLQAAQPARLNIGTIMAYA
jgi:hypothetical protein